MPCWAKPSLIGGICVYSCTITQGNYPYPSDYILNGVGLLPAFPMRVACSHMAEADPSDTALLHGLAAAAGVFYNYSHDVPCFNYRCSGSL